jgi:myosin heavy subunit
MDSSVGAGRGSNSSGSVGRTQVYIPDKEFAWLAGEIVHGNNPADSGEIEVRITDEQYLSKEHATPQRKVDLSAHGLAMLPLQNNAEEAPDGVADLGSLSCLHEPAIMDTLRR